MWSRLFLMFFLSATLSTILSSCSSFNKIIDWDDSVFSKDNYRENQYDIKETLAEPSVINKANKQDSKEDAKKASGYSESSN